MWTSYTGPYKYTELGQRFFASLQCVMQRALGWLDVGPKHICLNIYICHGQPILAGLALKGCTSMPPEFYFGLSAQRVFNTNLIYAVSNPEIRDLASSVRMFVVEISKIQKS